MINYCLLFNVKTYTNSNVFNDAYNKIYDRSSSVNKNNIDVISHHELYKIEEYIKKGGRVDAESNTNTKKRGMELQEWANKILDIL